MDDVQLAVGREVDVEVVPVFAEIRRPDDAGKRVQRGGYRPPVDEVLRVPDDQPRHVIKARVREIKIIAHANGTRIRMIATEDRVAKRRRPSLRKGEARSGWQRESSRKG